MTRGRTHQGKHGWLLRCSDDPMILVVRVIDGLSEPTDRFIHERSHDPNGLLVAIFGHPVDSETLDRLLNTIARDVNLSKRYIAVVTEQAQDEELHLVLKKIDRITNVSVVNLAQVTYHFIPSAQWSIAAFQRHLSSVQLENHRRSA